MRIQNALIAWNSPLFKDQSYPNKYPLGVKVVERTVPFPSDWSAGFRSTWGAFCPRWRGMNENEAAIEILIMFRRIVLQGVPSLVVHRAFFDIDGYRRAGGWEMSWDGDDFNP